MHTTYSFDTFAMGTIATPYDAYKFAKGEGIAHPAGFELKLREPLDFYAVTDHAMFLGVAAESADTSTEFSKNEAAEPLHNFNAPENKGTDLSEITQRMTAFGSFLPRPFYIEIQMSDSRSREGLGAASCGTTKISLSLGSVQLKPKSHQQRAIEAPAITFFRDLFRRLWTVHSVFVTPANPFLVLC